MASTSKAFKKCVDPCPSYLTPDDTHDCCVFCLGEEHARGVFEGAICVHCELFSMRKLRSRLSLFSRKEGQPSADSGPTATEARRRMKLWGSQADLADELERELSLSHESAGNEGEPLDYGDAISLTSSDPAASALLGYAQKEQEMSEGEEENKDWTLSNLLPCIRRAVGSYGTRHGEASLAVGVNQDERDASMSDTSPAINPQLRWAFHSFLISIQRLRGNGKSRFPPTSTGFSILVMPTLPGCVKVAMRGCHL